MGRVVYSDVRAAPGNPARVIHIKKSRM